MTVWGVVRGVAAFVLIVAGVWLWSIPAALVVAGLLLLADLLSDRIGGPPGPMP